MEPPVLAVQLCLGPSWKLILVRSNSSRPREGALHPQASMHVAVPLISPLSDMRSSLVCGEVCGEGVCSLHKSLAERAWTTLGR